MSIEYYILSEGIDNIIIDNKVLIIIIVWIIMIMGLKTVC